MFTNVLIFAIPLQIKYKIIIIIKNIKAHSTVKNTLKNNVLPYVIKEAVNASLTQLIEWKIKYYLESSIREVGPTIKELITACYETNDFHPFWMTYNIPNMTIRLILTGTVPLSSHVSGGPQKTQKCPILKKRRSLALQDIENY